VIRGDTGLASADAGDDFARLRRRQALSGLASRLRREPDDVNLILPFDDVVRVLGRVGERYLGLQLVTIDSIVGSVDRTREFDRRFRPTSARGRQRWERIALAQRRGEAMPPVELYRVGELHFVRDGHHRISIAVSRGLPSIDAYVTEILTRVPARGIGRRGDLLVKDYERVFRLRVPLPDELAATIAVRDPFRYAELSETVEAWGFRMLQDEGSFAGRPEVARRWYDEEYRPVVAMLHDADLVGGDTDADAYLRVACERYRLMRTHRWDDDVIQRLQASASRRRG
jgi:hypothetical protein